MKCEDCSHAEMCKWIDELEGRGCDFGEPCEDAISRETIEDIKAEIQAIEINGQVDEHTMFISSGVGVKNMALEIIDKHTKAEMESEDDNE